MYIPTTANFLNPYYSTRPTTPHHKVSIHNQSDNLNQVWVNFWLPNWVEFTTVWSQIYSSKALILFVVCTIPQNTFCVCNAWFTNKLLFYFTLNIACRTLCYTHKKAFRKRIRYRHPPPPYSLTFFLSRNLHPLKPSLFSFSYLTHHL